MGVFHDLLKERYQNEQMLKSTQVFNILGALPVERLTSIGILRRKELQLVLDNEGTSSLQTLHVSNVHWIVVTNFRNGPANLVFV